MKKYSYHKKPKLNINCFNKIGHVESYWLGYLFADGCICKTTKDRYIINLTSIDKEVIVKFHKFVCSKNKIQEKDYNNKKVYAVSFSNKYLYYKLKEYGMKSRKTKILDAPNIDETYVFSFLCGYFDGDGSISISKNINSWRVSIGFASLKFYNWFNSILDSKNLIYSIENNRRTKLNKKFYISCLNGISGKKFLELCYENIPSELSLKRKQRKYKELCKVNNLSNPRFQKWEIDIIKRNGIESGILLINKDSRNYGWIRGIESTKRVMQRLNNK